jgi:hypothetical protein
MRTWAYALSSVRDTGDKSSTYQVVETGFVPVVADIARPDFSEIKCFFENLKDRYGLGPRLGGFSCDLVAERYVGRGHTGSLNESIPFHLGIWISLWRENYLGECRLLMASQWKLKAKKYNQQVDSAPFENWWEDYYSYLLPNWELNPTKSTERHLQDACCIGWYYWTYEKKIFCLPKGIKELLS